MAAGVSLKEKKSSAVKRITSEGDADADIAEFVAQQQRGSKRGKQEKAAVNQPIVERWLMVPVSDEETAGLQHGDVAALYLSTKGGVWVKRAPLESESAARSKESGHEESETESEIESEECDSDEDGKWTESSSLLTLAVVIDTEHMVYHTGSEFADPCLMPRGTTYGKSVVLMLAGVVDKVTGCHGVKKGDTVTRAGRIVGVALDNAGCVRLCAWMNALDGNLLRVGEVEALLREIESQST